MEEHSGAPHQRRIVTLGFSHVGKTALCVRFVENRFNEAYEPTFENSYSKTMVHAGEEVELVLKDTQGDDGQSVFRAEYGFGYHGYVLVYSITSRRSLETLISINEKLINLKGTTLVPRVIVGNKADLDSENLRQVTRKQGEALAAQWGCAFVECSAKRGENIDGVFRAMLDEVDKVYDTGRGHRRASSGATAWFSRAAEAAAGSCCCRPSLESSTVVNRPPPAPRGPTVAAFAGVGASLAVSLACLALAVVVGFTDSGDGDGGGGGGGGGGGEGGSTGDGGRALTAYAMFGFGFLALLLGVVGLIGLRQRNWDFVRLFSFGTAVLAVAEPAAFFLTRDRSEVLSDHATLATALVLPAAAVQAAACLAALLLLARAPEDPRLAEPLFAGRGSESRLFESPGAAGLSRWRETRVY